MGRLEGGRVGKWKCDVCGKEEYWNPQWRRYSSIALDETCPYDVPAACSAACVAVVEQKLKSGEWKLPVIRSDAGGFRLTHGKQGY